MKDNPLELREHTRIDEYLYRGLHNFSSKCALDIFRLDGKCIVIATELADNPGTSVTNGWEMIATQVYRQFFTGTPVAHIKWIERYPADSILPERFDEVELTWVPRIGEFRGPYWKPVSQDIHEKLVKLMSL